MLNGAVLSLTLLVTLSLSDLTLGRMVWAERDGKAVLLNPRRFGQEHPQVITDLSNACPGQFCGTLAGAAITPLLAAQPECSQQDMADQIIDVSKQFDDKTQANMLALAKEYRQAEKNTPQDFSTNPPTPRNSVFCQKPPKHRELNCLVQKQDPANNPDLFFDPTVGQKSVKKGSQPNTRPFCENNKANPQGSQKNNGKGSNDQDTTTTPTTSDKQTKTSTSPTTTPTNNGCTKQQSKSSTQNNNTGNNLQAFTGSLGSPPPAVTKLASGQFQVQNNAAFQNLGNALTRSCDVQKNKCADAANSSSNKGDLTVSACETQHTSCVSAAGN